MKLQYLLLAVLPVALAKFGCECPQVKCPGDQTALCKCLNQAAIRCYERCGNPACLKRCPKGSGTTTSSLPEPTRTICGSRGLPPCPEGTTCVNDPAKPGCDIRADCPGLCVKLDGPFCGGIANFSCPDPEQVCVDDPRDDCSPPTGADCSGTCVFFDGRSSAPPLS